MQQPYALEDDGSDDCQVEDESQSIVGLAVFDSATTILGYMKLEQDG